MRNTKILAVACVGLGALLGYAVASGRLNPSQRAQAGPAASNVDQPARFATPDPSLAAQERLDGCCDGVNKGEMVVLTAHNQKVADEAQKSGTKPNICIIWGDDIGQSNLSCYTRGLLGYQTPNIDRIAREGMMFTDCTSPSRPSSMIGPTADCWSTSPRGVMKHRLRLSCGGTAHSC